MDNLDAQDALNEFEAHMLADSPLSTARTYLRRALFKLAHGDEQGSLADAIELLVQQATPQPEAASIVLRAIATEGLFLDNSSNHLARNVVSLVEKGLPKFVSFFDLQKKGQTYEKYAHLCGAKTWADGLLGVLTVPYSSLDSMVAAKKQVQSALGHGRLADFCKAYRLLEIRDSIESVFSGLEHVSRTEATLVADVEVCERAIGEARRLVSKHPSFVTKNYLHPWLDCAELRLSQFIESLRGRFTALIAQDWSGVTLPKRYPLQERDRELRILVPFRSEGRGAATDVKIKISGDDSHVLFLNEEISSGNVSPGKFSVALDVHVVDPCDELSVMLEIEWGEVGTSLRQNALFEISVRAQACGIDWDAYLYADPYHTAPAEGSDFVGRQEQIQILVARMLRKPMEPSYITGQKRVGKTSLATAAAEEAKTRDPMGKLSWHYILWGEIAHEDPRISLRQLGEQIAEFIIGELPGSAALPKGDFDGSLSPLIKLSAAAKLADPDRRFIVIIDEFDEMPQELYLQGNLADTVFGNIRAITTTKNFSLLLVGGENMPFVMDRQGQKLNKFSRVNLTYFDRATELDDYIQLIREPSRGFLEWHFDAIAEIYDLTNGNPYFSKIICSKVFARALRERDVDITREEVRAAVNAEISRLDDNLFAHLWQDGIFAPIEEREPIVLKRKRVLAALARCLRAGAAATVSNLCAYKNVADLTETELRSVLADFVGREVLIERDGDYRTVLPIFELWLLDVGLTRLAADALSQDLASESQRADDAARVLSEELVELTQKWPTYRGRHIGPEEVRAWLNQRSGNRDQRALFSILKAVRFLSENDILERIRNARLAILGVLEPIVRKKNTERRNDIVVTYVDGEGKSGQKYASMYAEENLISTAAILPPSSFKDAYLKHVGVFGPPKMIIVIDDFVGTGRSLSGNVKAFHDSYLDVINIDKPDIFVFALLATVEGQQSVLKALSKLDYEKIDFRAGELLEKSASIFSDEMKAFSGIDEMERARSVAMDVGSTIYKNAPLGFGDQALAIVFPTTVPNNCLPLLHSRGKGTPPLWVPLFERLVN